MKKVTSLKGREIDITALREANAEKVALGNASMNARGDIVGRGGEIVRSKDDIVRDYYDSNPKAVTVSNVALNSIADEILSPQEAMASFDKLKRDAAAQAEQAAAQSEKPSRRKMRDSED